MLRVHARVLPLLLSLVLIFVITNIDETAASEVIDADGIWNGVYEYNLGPDRDRDQEGFKAIFHLEIVRGYGEILIQMMPKGFVWGARCEYIFTLEGLEAKDALLFRNKNTVDPCRDRLSFRFERKSTGELLAHIEGHSSVNTVSLLPEIRPVRAQDHAKKPENFDVLGLVPGTSKEEIEQKLSELGFAYNAELSFVTDTTGFKFHGDKWTEELAVYFKKADHALREYESVVVQYTAKTAVFDEPVRAYAITRRWDVPQETQLTPETLSNALSEKYGPGGRWDARYYDRNGINLNSGSDQLTCLPDTMKGVSFYPYSAGNRLDRGSVWKPSAACGHIVMLEIYVIPGPTPEIKFVASLTTTLLDVDEVMHNEWRIRSIDILERLKANYEFLTNAQDSVPEL